MDDLHGPDGSCEVSHITNSPWNDTKGSRMSPVCTRQLHLLPAEFAPIHPT